VAFAARLKPCPDTKRLRFEVSHVENPDMGHPAIVQRTSVLSGAKARNIFVGFMRGLKPQPPPG